jgi:pimeloyl-ACP methyl ester carboxylesterase
MVSTDIATYLPSGTVAGFVFLGGPPYTSVLHEVRTSFARGQLVHLQNEESSPKLLVAMTNFVDALFYSPESVPWELKTFWVGMVTLQSPSIRFLTMSRSQEMERFHELGRQGMPLLILGGRDDKLIDTNKIVSLLEPHFKNMEVGWIEERGSHTFFYDNMEETMRRISDFVRRVID